KTSSTSLDGFPKIFSTSGGGLSATRFKSKRRGSCATERLSTQNRSKNPRLRMIAFEPVEFIGPSLSLFKSFDADRLIFIAIRWCRAGQPPGHIETKRHEDY